MDRIIASLFSFNPIDADYCHVDSFGICMNIEEVRCFDEDKDYL